MRQKPHLPIHSQDTLEPYVQSMDDYLFTKEQEQHDIQHELIYSIQTRSKIQEVADEVAHIMDMLSSEDSVT